MIGKLYYFIEWTSPYLYVWDVERNRLADCIEFQDKMLGGMVFKQFIYWEDKIWMIPGRSEFICVYDIKTRTFSKLPIPCDFSENEEPVRFNSILSIGEYIWAVTYHSHKIIRINMRRVECEIISKWPTGIRFNSEDTIDFHSLCDAGEDIVLLRGTSELDIAIDKKTGKMRTILLPVFRRFCVIDGKEIFILPTVEKDPVLRKVDVESGAAISIPIPEDCKRGISEGYWYCNAKMWNGKLLIFPFSAKKMLIFDCSNSSLKTVNLKKEGFRTIREDDGFVVTEDHLLEQMIMLPSFGGNHILLLNNKNEIEKIIKLEVELGAYENASDFQNIEYEQTSNSIQGLIRFIHKKSECKNIEWVSIKEL